MDNWWGRSGGGAPSFNTRRHNVSRTFENPRQTWVNWLDLSFLDFWSISCRQQIISVNWLLLIKNQLLKFKFNQLIVLLLEANICLIIEIIIKWPMIKLNRSFSNSKLIPLSRSFFSVCFAFSFYNFTKKNISNRIHHPIERQKEDILWQIFPFSSTHGT